MFGQDRSKEHAKQRAAEYAYKHDRPGCDWAHSTSLTAGAAEHPRLDFGVRWIGTEPDRQKCLCKIFAFDCPFHGAVYVHLQTRAGLVDEGKPLAGFDIAHPTVERGDTLLQRRQLILGILFESFAPALPKVVRADAAHELEN